MDDDDDVDGDCLYWELSWHLLGEAWWSQTDLIVLSGEGGAFGRVSAWLFNDTWTFPLYKWTNQGGDDDDGGDGQTSWCHFTHLPTF